MTPQELTLVFDTLKAGGFLEKTMRHEGASQLKLFDKDCRSIAFVSTNEQLSSLLYKPRNKKRGMRLNLQRLKQLHGNCFIKKVYKQWKKSEAAIDQHKQKDMAQFKEVSPKAILPDPNQPRKFFNEQAMLELQESIAVKGVLQPVMIRPIGSSYMLVAGERRLRASIAVGLETIPCMVRELTDDEALEVQITENLQRKDVHAMEEALAFGALGKKHSIEEVANRVGKSQGFVAKRMKLCDLIPLAQEVFFNDKMEMKHALMLSRLSPEDQAIVLKEVLDKNWQQKDHISTWKLESLCASAMVQLDKAPFKTNDGKLYPEAGACTKCIHNTNNLPLLFDDLKGRHCTKRTCFEIKRTRHEKKQLESLAADPNLIAIAGSYPSNDERVTVEAAREMGINVLDSKLYERVYSEPSHPGSFEDYLKEYDFDETTDSKEDYEKDYQEAVADYEEEKKNLEQAKAEGRVVNAYMLTGYDKGKSVLVEIKAAAQSMVETSTGNAGDAALKMEIAKINQREERNKELDAEKVHAAVQTLMQSETEFLDEQPKRGLTLTPAEIVAAAVALYDAGGYSFREWMRKTLSLEAGYTDLKASAITQLKPLTELGLNEILRHFIMDKLPCQATSRFVSGKSAALHQLAEELYGPYVANILQEQEEVTNKRQERVNARIKALEKKLTTKADAITGKKSKQVADHVTA